MVESTSQRVEAEVKKAIAYLNDEVAPKIRQSSSEGLRAIAAHLRRLADHLERDSSA